MQELFSTPNLLAFPPHCELGFQSAIPIPGIIWNHGSTGNYCKNNEPKCVKLIDSFLGMGMVVFSPSRSGYDGVKGITFEEGLKNFKKAEQCDAFLIRKLKTECQEIIEHVKKLKKCMHVNISPFVCSGYSLGGILTLILTVETNLFNLAILFSPGAIMWDKHPKIKELIIHYAKRITVPIMIIQAANDYSLSPAHELQEIFSKLKVNYEVLIYPPHGNTPEQAHAFYETGCEIWRDRVICFLKQNGVL